MASEFSRQIAARAWCTEKTSNIPIDADLCEAFADIIEVETARARLKYTIIEKLIDELKKEMIIQKGDESEKIM